MLQLLLAGWSKRFNLDPGGSRGSRRQGVAGAEPRGPQGVQGGGSVGKGEERPHGESVFIWAHSPFPVFPLGCWGKKVEMGGAIVPETLDLTLSNCL